MISCPILTGSPPVIGNQLIPLTSSHTALSWSYSIMLHNGTIAQYTHEHLRHTQCHYTKQHATQVRRAPNHHAPPYHAQAGHWHRRELKIYPSESDIKLGSRAHQSPISYSEPNPGYRIQAWHHTLLHELGEVCG